MNVYEPAEDSQLMLESIRDYLNDKNNLQILEMGVGSGFIAKQIKGHQVIGADINKHAVEAAEKIGIKVIQTNLFENIEGKFDLIYFNPPYLPQDKVSEQLSIDTALYGGKKGYEITHEFLKKLNNHLEENGTCLLLLCNISKPQLSLDLAESLGFNCQLVNQTYAFPEQLFIYKLTKSKLLKKSNELGYNNFHHLAKGKKGRVFTAQKNEKERNQKEAKSQAKRIKFKIALESGINIQNETEMLNRLTKEDFVQKLIYASKENDYFIQEFAPGKMISDWLPTASKKQLLKAFEKIVLICQRLDELQIDKKEMTNPYKHIIIDQRADEEIEVKFIDFERSSLSESPKNVTQVINYFTSSNMEQLLIKHGVHLDKEELNALAKKYKDNYDKKYFEQILSCIRSKFF